MAENTGEKRPAVETLVVECGGLAFTMLACGEGPVVLCLHGFPDHAHSFREQLPALAKAGYRAIAPALRGYEPSSQPVDDDYSLGALAGDVVAWIDALGADKVHLIGHDWGAVVAYLAGALFPQRFHTLTGIAVPHAGRLAELGVRKVPSQLLKSWYMAFFQLRGFADYVLPLSDWWLVRKLWRDWSPSFDLPADEWARLRATLAKPGVKKAMLAYYRQNVALSSLLGRTSARPRAPTIVPVPTLAITGADDGCIDTRLFDHVFLDEDFPKGHRIERLAEAGHFVHQERPEDVNRLILDWLEQTER